MAGNMSDQPGNEYLHVIHDSREVNPASYGVLQLDVSLQGQYGSALAVSCSEKIGVIGGS